LIAIHRASDDDAARWDDFVAGQTHATGYHEWSWRGVFARAFGHESIYLMALDGGRLAGVLPLVQINSLVFGRTLTSLPFVNYGGVLAASPEAALALQAASASCGRERRCRHVELRHVARQFPELPCKQHKVSMKLTLVPDLWKALDGKVRNQIRKAQKSGLTGERGGVELLPDFYGVFARNMRDLGTPVYSERVFAEVLRAFPGRAHLHIVRLNGMAIAGALTFRTGGTTEVPWASSVRDYNSLCPNHLLYWGIIEAAAAGGGATLDFGRSTPDEGTFKFKQQWGARPVPLHWEYPLVADGFVPNASPANPKYRVAIEVWKKLPLSIATRFGPRIVRSIP
jgi:FemAB-related protein (PEP-CTERM system-associated)